MRYSIKGEGRQATREIITSKSLWASTAVMIVSFVAGFIIIGGTARLPMTNIPTDERVMDQQPAADAIEHTEIPEAELKAEEQPHASETGERTPAAPQSSTSAEQKNACRDDSRRESIGGRLGRAIRGSELSPTEERC